MKRRLVSSALAGAAMWMLLGPAMASPSKEKLAMAKDAKVELTDAVAKATGKAPGRAIEIELKKKKARLVWEVEVLGADDKISEVDVDAKTGEVVDTEAKK
jgi:uncharacterized membrane protein YkoI